MQYIPIITLVLVVILLGLVIVLLTRKPEKPELPQQIDPTASITALGTLVTQNLREGREAQSNQLSAMDKSLGDKMSGLTISSAGLRRVCRVLRRKQRRI